MITAVCRCVSGDFNCYFLEFSLFPHLLFLLIGVFPALFLGVFTVFYGGTQCVYCVLFLLFVYCECLLHFQVCFPMFLGVFTGSFPFLPALFYPSIGTFLERRATL